MHLQVRIIRLSILLLLCVTILQGCRGTGREKDSRLKAIEEIINSAPAQAAARLDSIDPEMLSEPDRHLYTILNTSARDKLFLELESDSAILEAVRYYSDTPSSYRLAQSSYLAGRVYHNMGNHPSAIRYYQKSLDNIPSDSLTSYLRGCVLSQMAALLEGLHLYRQTVNYLREAIKLDSIRQDTISLAYDYKGLAIVYRNNMQHLDSAQYLLEKAWQLSPHISQKWKNSIHLDMVNTLVMRDDIDEALSWLHNLKDTTSIQLNKYLYTASRTFYKAGKLDTAYYYAKCLAFGDNDLNRKTGFDILLSDEVYNRIPADSLRIVVLGMRDAVYNYLDRSDGHQAALQTAVYNYSIHERDKDVAEKKANKYSVWIVVLSCIAFVSLVIVLILVIRSQRKEIEYLKSKERISALEHEVQKYRELKSINSVQTSPKDEEEIKEAYRDKFRKEILEMAKNISDSRKVPEALQKKATYDYIQELIIKEEWIKDNDMWNKIRIDVETSCPRLRERAELLADSYLTPRDLEIIWLTKNGVTATQLAILLNRTKGSISSRRVQLGIKLFGEKLSAPFVDKAIRSL